MKSLHCTFNDSTFLRVLTQLSFNYVGLFAIQLPRSFSDSNDFPFLNSKKLRVGCNDLEIETTKDLFEAIDAYSKRRIK